MDAFATNNRDAIEAWNTVLFDKFVRFRHIAAAGLGTHGDAVLAKHPPVPGTRVLDLGCGFGDTTLQIARLVGATGAVLGIDAAARFIEAARKEAADAGITNARFVLGDVQTATFDEQFDGFPMFSPDGNWLVFASNRGGKERGETNLFLAEWKK